MHHRESCTRLPTGYLVSSMESGINYVSSLISLMIRRSDSRLGPPSLSFKKAF